MQRHKTSPAGAWSWRQAISTEVPEADTSTTLTPPPPPPRTMEQLQACSLSRWSLMAASVRWHVTPMQVLGLGGKQSPPKCQRQRRARTLTPPPPPPRNMVQPQACSLSRWSLMAASVRMNDTLCRCLVLVASTLHQSARHVQRQRRTRTLPPPPTAPRTVEHLRACSISGQSLISTLHRSARGSDEHAP